MVSETVAQSTAEYNRCIALLVYTASFEQTDSEIFLGRAGITTTAAAAAAAAQPCLYGHFVLDSQVRMAVQPCEPGVFYI